MKSAACKLLKLPSGWHVSHPDGAKTGPYKDKAEAAGYRDLYNGMLANRRSSP